MQLLFLQILIIYEKKKTKPNLEGSEMMNLQTEKIEIHKSGVVKKTFVTD